MPVTGKAIITENLTKVFGGRTIALNNANLQIEPASVVGVVGPNGAGKTTLIKLLLGLFTPTSGKVMVLDQKMGTNSAALRRRMGYMPAEPKFPPDMSVLEYLDFVGRLNAVPRAIRRSRVGQLIDAVELKHLVGERTGRLSSGHRARLAMAASLINDPEVIIWDEPARALDADARSGLVDLTRQLAASKTLILCCHQLAEVQEACTQAIGLHEGRVVYHGSVDDLSEGSRVDAVEVAVTGDKKEIAEAFKAIGKFQEVEGIEINRNVIRFRIHPDVSKVTVLANVLVTIADRSLELADLRIMGGAGSNPIAQLARKEANRGISRASETLRAA